MTVTCDFEKSEGTMAEISYELVEVTSFFNAPLSTVESSKWNDTLKAAARRRRSSATSYNTSGENFSCEEVARSLPRKTLTVVDQTSKIIDKDIISSLHRKLLDVTIKIPSTSSASFCTDLSKACVELIPDIVCF